MKDGDDNVLVDIVDAEGQILIAPAGVAARFTVTDFDFTLPGLTIGTGTIEIRINTTPIEVNESFTVAGSTTMLTLPAGPYVSVVVLGADVTLAGTIALSGDFAFDQATKADGSIVTRIGVTNLEVAVMIGADGATLTDGEGGFVVLPTGIAGYVSGDVSAYAGPLELGGRILLRVNKSGVEVDETIQVGARDVHIRFGPTEGDVFEVAISGLTLHIGDFISVEGNVAFSSGKFAGTGLKVFLGQGPATLANGELNPLATGILLTNARIGVVKVGANYAFVGTGDVSIVGIDGLTISGTVSVRFNSTGAPVDETITIAGSAGDEVVVSFANGDAVKSFQVLNGQLGVLGQTLSGNFGFDQTAAGDISIAATNVALSLGGGTVSLTGGTGALLIGAAGLAGEISGTVAVNVPGVSFAGDFTVAVNTTLAPVNKTFELGGDAIVLNLPTGPYLRVEGEGVTLTILGQTLSGNFVIERTADTTVIGASAITFALQAGGTDVVRLDDGEGAFVVTAAGIAGRIGGNVTLTLPAAISFTGTFGLAINNTTAAVHQEIEVAGRAITLDLPAGPYLRVEGTGIQLDILGQRLSGDFAFEQSTDLGANGAPGGPLPADADVTVVRIGARNVNLSLGGATPLISITGAQGALFILPAGIAGRVQGTVAVNVPGVSLTGALEIQFNNTAAEIDETFQVGASPVTLQLPVGPYVRIAGTGVDLNVLGQTLRGDFAITKTPTQVQIEVEHAVLKLGGTSANPILTVTQQGTSTFVLTSAGVAGSITASVAVAVPGISLGGTFTVALNTTTAPAQGLPAGPYLRVEGSPVSLDLLGQTLSGSFALEQATNAQGQKVVRVGVTGLTISLAGGLVSVNQGTGLFVLTPSGVAGTIGATVGVSVPGISLGGTFALSINTTGSAVAQSLKVGNATVSIDLPAGPYVRVEGTGVRLDVLGQRLTGDFAIEQVTIGSGTDGIPGNLDDQHAVKVAVVNGSLSLGDGSKNFLSLTSIEGAFLILDASPGTAGGTGIAGRIGATVALQNVPGVSLTGDLKLEVNNTGLAIDQVLLVGGLPVPLKLDPGNYLRVSGEHVGLTVAGQQLSGNFSFERDTTVPTAPVVKVSFSDVEVGLGDGTRTFVRVTNGSGDLVLLSTGIYGRFGGSVAVDVPGVTFSGAFQVKLNTTTDPQDLTGPAETLPASSFKIVGTNVSLTIAGQQIGAGGFIVESLTDAGPDGILGGVNAADDEKVVSIAINDLTLALGAPDSPFVNVTAANDLDGAIRIDGLGVSATFTGTVLPATFTLPAGITLAATSFKIEVNTGPVPVDATFVVDADPSVAGTDTIAIDVPAGPFFRVAVDGATLGLDSGPSFQGNFVFEQSQKSGFAAGTPVETPATDATNAVVAGDVDKDGDLDLVMGITGADRLYLNSCSPSANCTPTFAPASAALFTAATDDTRALTLVDVNGDGFLDLVAANNGSVGKVYLNRGTVTNGALVTWRGFDAGMSFGSASAATSVAAGDVDGDGLADVVIGVAGAANELYLNGGNSAVRSSPVGAPDGVQFTGSPTFTAASGAFTAADEGRLIEIAGTTFRIITRTNATSVVLDRPATATGGGLAWSIREWGGLALAASGYTPDAATTTVAVVLADVNKDNLLDLIVGNTGDPSKLYLNLGDTGTAGWDGFDAGTALFTSGNTSAIGVGDLDGDGFLDLVVGNNGSSSKVFLNLGEGTTPGWDGFSATAHDVGTPADTRAVAIGDVDGDGLLDVVLANAAPDVSEVLVNRGLDALGTTWLGVKAGVPVGDAAAVTSAVLLNVDTDHDLDLILGVSGAPSMLFRTEQVPVTIVAFSEVIVSLTPSGGGSALGIEDGQGAFIIVSGTSGGVAGNFSGKVSADLGDFGADASVSVRFNSTTQAFDEEIVVGGVTIPVKFASPDEVRVGTTNFVEFAGSGTIRIGDFIEIEGSFTGGPAAGSGTANIFMGQGPSKLEDGSPNPTAKGILLENARFSFKKTGGFYAVFATGTVKILGIPGLKVSGTVTVRYNETGADVTFTDVPDGPDADIDPDTETVLGTATTKEVAGDLSLEMMGLSLSGGFAFSDPGDGTFTVALDDVTLNLGEGPPYPVSVTIATGSFTITPAGLYGELTGTPTISVPGFDITTTVNVTVNTTADPVDHDGLAGTPLIPAHFFRVEATDTSLNVLGQTLSGDFAFEQVDGALSPQAPAGTPPPKIVRIGASNVELFIGDNGTTTGFATISDDAGVWLTGGTGFFILTPAGLAGQIGGTITFAIPGGGVDVHGHLRRRGQHDGRRGRRAVRGRPADDQPQPAGRPVPPCPGHRRPALALRAEDRRRLRIRAGHEPRRRQRRRRDRRQRRPHRHPRRRPQRHRRLRRRHHELRDPRRWVRLLRPSERSRRARGFEPEDRRPGRRAGRRRHGRHPRRDPPRDVLAGYQQHELGGRRDDQVRRPTRRYPCRRDRRRQRRRAARPRARHGRRRPPLPE